MRHPPAIVERLLAHARICREIADTTLDDEMARELARMAEDCLKAASETGADARNQMFPAGRLRAV